MFSPVDSSLAMFAGAAGRAAVFEIRTRLFVDAVPDLSGSLTDNLKPLVERKLIPWLERETKITPTETTLLLACAVIRNKMFHFEFSSVAKRLESLDVELAKHRVTRFVLTEKVTAENFAATIQSGGVSVSTTLSEEGGMVGWLFEAAASGAFGEAASKFEEGAGLLVRLLHEWTDAQPSEVGATRR